LRSVHSRNQRIHPDHSEGMIGGISRIMRPHSAWILNGG
jgi:hypothetical protein